MAAGGSPGRCVTGHARGRAGVGHGADSSDGGAVLRATCAGATAARRPQRVLGDRRGPDRRHGWTAAAAVRPRLLGQPRSAPPMGREGRYLHRVRGARARLHRRTGQHRRLDRDVRAWYLARHAALAAARKPCAGRRRHAHVPALPACVTTLAPWEDVVGFHLVML